MRTGNKPCELLSDTLLLCVIYPHVPHVDSHEADIEFDSPPLVEGLRQLRPEPVDSVVAPDHDHVITVRDDERGVKLGEHVPIAFDGDDRTAGPSPDISFHERLADQSGSGQSNDANLRVEGDHLGLLDDERGDRGDLLRYADPGRSTVRSRTGRRVSPGS